MLPMDERKQAKDERKEQRRRNREKLEIEKREKFHELMTDPDRLVTGHVMPSLERLRWVEEKGGTVTKFEVAKRYGSSVHAAYQWLRKFAIQGILVQNKDDFILRVKGWMLDDSDMAELVQ